MKAGVQGKSHFRIHTPLNPMIKAETARKGHELGVDLGLTWSCYAPSEEGARACGLSDACLLWQKAFAEVGLVDPLTYAR